MWVRAMNSLLLLLGFPFGLGWTSPDSRPNNFSFPLVFLQPSPLVYILLSKLMVWGENGWQTAMDGCSPLHLPWAHKQGHHATGNSTVILPDTNKKVLSSSSTKTTTPKMPLFLYSCRLLTKGTCFISSLWEQRHWLGLHRVGAWGWGWELGVCAL